MPDDDESQIRRVAENEAAFRAANEKLRVAFETAGSKTLPFLCECGDLNCRHFVVMTLGQYRNTEPGSVVAH